jgi:hypothetical protein
LFDGVQGADSIFLSIEIISVYGFYRLYARRFLHLPGAGVCSVTPRCPRRKNTPAITAG